MSKKGKKDQTERRPLRIRAARAAAAQVMKKGGVIFCALILVIGTLVMVPSAPAEAEDGTTQTYEYTFGDGGDVKDGSYYLTLCSSSGASAHFCGPEDNKNASVEIDGITINMNVTEGSFNLWYSNDHAYLNFHNKSVSLSIEGGGRYISKVELISYGHPPGEYGLRDYAPYSKNNRTRTFSDTLSGELSARISKIRITTSTTEPEKENGSGSVSLDDWTYGEAAKTPVPSSETNGTGNVICQYYTDQDCTVKTTADNSGAASEGGVPANAGTYYVQASFAENDAYKACTATDSFTIHKAQASYTAPAAKSDLKYNGSDQELVTAGSVSQPAGGSFVYSLYQNGPFRTTVPIATRAKDYTVWYKMEGTSNVEGVGLKHIQVTIAKRNVTLTSGSASKSYDGTALTNSGVEVSGDGFVSNEGAKYTVTGSQTDAGTSKNTFTYKLRLGTNGSNYNIDTIEGDLTVNSIGASFTAPTAKTGLTYNGSAQPLVNAGSIDANAGQVEYSLDDSTYSAEIPTAKKAGKYRVYYKVTGKNGNYTYGSTSGSLEVTIGRKSVKVSGITAADKTYDGTTDAAVHTDDAVLTGKVTGDDLTISATGTFSDANAGESKTVSISGLTLGGDDAGNYFLAKDGQQAETTAAIEPREAALTWSQSDFIYDGKTHQISAEVNNKALSSDTFVIEYLNTGKQTVSAADTGNYTAAVTSLGNDNYTLPASEKTKAWSINYLDVSDAAITGTQGGDGWYISAVSLTAPEGCTIKTSDGEQWKDSVTFTEDGDRTVSYRVKNGSGQISDVKTAEFKIDTAAPEGAITIRDNAFKTSLNTVTFGHFFKDRVDVTVSGSDDASGIKDISYYKSAEAMTEEEVKALADDQWTNLGAESSGTFAIEANDQCVVYGRFTDKAGHSTCISSDGMTLYQDAEPVSADLAYTRTTEEDQTAEITLNGNTVKEVRNGDAVLKEGNDYSLDSDGKITFKGAYLESLAAGVHELTVSFNPIGLAYEQSDGSDAPADTSVQITVSKADAKVQPPEGLTLSYTGGEQELVKAGTTSGGTMEYSLDGETWSSDIPTASEAGEYQVFFRVSGGENYNDVDAGSVQATVNAPVPVQPVIDPTDPAVPTDPQDTDDETKDTDTDGSGTIDGSGVNPKSPETAEKTVDIKLSSKGKTTVKFTPASGKDAATSFKFKARKDGSFTFKVKGMTSATVRLCSASGKVLVTENLKSLKSNSGISTTYVGLRSGKSYSIEVTKADLAEGQTECTATASNPGGTGRSYFRKALIKAKIGETYRIQNSACKKFSQTFKVKATKTGTLKIQPLDNRGWTKIYTSGGKKLLFNGKNKGVSHQQYRVTKGKTYRIVFTAHPVKNSHYDVGFRYKS